MNRFFYQSLIAVLLFGTVTAKAQCDDEWTSHVRALPNGGLGNNLPRLLSDSFGNVYAYAVMVNTDSLNISGTGISFPMTTTANNGFFCVKYAPDGAVQWIVPINSTGTCSPTGMQVDGQGNVYMSGNMRSQLTVHEQGIIAGPEQGTGYFIIKLSANGDLLWSKSADYGYSSVGCINWHEDRLYFSIGFSDSLTFDSETYQASPENLTGNFDQVYGYIDEDGSLLNAWLIGGAGSLDVRAIGCNSSGCIVQGRFDLEMQLSETTLTTPASLHYSLYQVFISHDGQLEWANNSINESDFVIHPHGLAVSDDGEWAVSSGFFEGYFSFGGHNMSLSSSKDAFFSRVDLVTGQVEWLFRTNGAGNDASESIGLTSSNAVLAISFSSNELEYQGEIFPNSQTDNSQDGLIMSLDSEGGRRCHKLVSGAGEQSVRFLHGYDDRYILAMINFSSPFSIGSNTYSPVGVNDMLVIKTCLPCDTLTSITEPTTTNPTLHIYPNPASQSVRVEVPGNSQQVYAVEVIDMLGHPVLQHRLALTGQQLDISGLASGIYTLAATLQSGETLRQRLVVQH